MRRFGLLIIAGVMLLCASQALAGGTKLVRHPHYHDGKLTFCYLGDIWILDEKVGVPRALTVHKASDLRPKFSPDGKWIAFSSGRSGNYDVYVIPVEGGKPRRLTFNSASDVVVTWTPDSKYVVFYSRRGRVFMGNLFKVSLEAELPEKLPYGRVYSASFDPAGRYVALNRNGPSYSRKRRRTPYNTDVWLLDTQDVKFTRLTEFDGYDNTPMISGGEIYFVSNRGGEFNIWKMPTKGGKPTQVTHLKGEGVIRPSISPDRSTIVYESNFEIWKFDIKSGKSTIVNLKLRTDYIENPVKYEKFTTVGEYDVSKDGKRVVISVHGEIFTVPVEKGRVVQITNSPARDGKPTYCPEGKRIAFVSDWTGEEQVYIVNADGTDLQQVTDTLNRKHRITWSPDGRSLSVVESDHSLWIYDVETKERRMVIKHEPRAPGSVNWSPDGKWIAYTKSNRNFWRDIHIVSTQDENPVEHAILEKMPYDEHHIRFTREKIFFLGEINWDWDLAVFSVDLARQEVDPDDPEAQEKKKKLKKKEKKEPTKKEEEKPGEEKEDEDKEAREKVRKLPEVKIDFDGIKRRVKEILRVKGKLRSLAVSPNGKDMVITVNESRGKETRTILYSVLEDGKKLKQIGSGSGIGWLRFSPNGKEIFYKSGGTLVHMPKSGGKAKKVAVSVPVKIDRAAEYAQIFNECWRIMKHHFYDPEMHGADWNAVRRKYAAVLPSVTDKEALSTVINKMLGELNASHVGFSPRRPSSGPSYTTMHPGFDLVPDAESGLYRVGHIYKKGPADHEWVSIKEGDYILSIDGQEPKVPRNYWKILNHPLNPRIEITVSADPEGKEKRTSTVRLESCGTVRSRSYHEWVDTNREKVDKLSGGRLAYAHIPSMGGSSLERFKSEIIEFRLKEGLIIDVRFNGGGNIDQQLLDILERRQFAKTVSRGSIPGRRPWNGFFGPKLVLIHERSFSDAECFPMGFRGLGLGKLVGTPTGGLVIATGGYGLIDGSSIRVPGTGWYTTKGVNLENYGVKPDIYVENSPEDDLARRDPQLERAVQELMKQLTAPEGD